MQTIDIPRIYAGHKESNYVIAIEGPNGVGKTTLINRLKKDHSDVNCFLCVPNIFQTAIDMKHFMLFESSALCSALYYLGGAVEVYENNKGCSSKILMDRSIWSTFASLYSKDETLLPKLFGCLEIVRDCVFIPDLVVLLDATYETCRLRSSKKIIGGEFDKDERACFDKKREFFYLLEKEGYNIKILDVNNLNADEVYDTFNEMILSKS